MLGCEIKDPVQRRFFVRYLVTMALYPFFAVAAVCGFLLGYVRGVLALPLAGLPALPIAAAVAAVGSYVAHEKDDFMRHLMLWSLLGGMGATMVVTTIWGFLEKYAPFQRLDLIWLWPIFWVLTVISFLAVKARYR